MSASKKNTSSRRQFLQGTSKVAAASALAGVALPQVHAQGGDMIQVALVGCGGRGTGAAGDALNTVKQGPIKLVAMADVFENRLKGCFVNLSNHFGNRVEVPKERQFIGFDAYQQAMNCLKEGDVVILTTPPAFRWVHMRYALQKGLNVFLEKPIAVDGPSCRKMFALGEEATKRNIKVGVGLMCRHCSARQDLYDRIKKGTIGDILLMRAYRMAGQTGSAHVGKKPNNISELLYQIRSFHAFLWASGGAFSDFLIHNIDECCWMKDAWPVQAKATGGRQYRGDQVDQNFDHYSVEYTFADGTKLDLHGRTIPGCHNEFASYAHGTRGSAVISTAAHTPARCRIYKGQNIVSSDLVWSCKQPEPNPYQLEWDHLINAIRRNLPYNETKRGTEASLVTAMGRMAAHTGRIITYDQMLKHTHEFAPEVDKLKLDGPAPLRADADGKYPVPQPGVVTDREY